MDKSNAQTLVKPILFFAYGNLSRGDDALGPLLLEFVEQHCDLAQVELLTDFQLQIEHALDLQYRELVLFADATVASTSAFSFTQLAPAQDKSYTTHAMSPAAVMSVYEEITKHSPPPCFLLGIKGESFELGAGLSASANDSLQLARRFVEQLLSEPQFSKWQAMQVPASI
jgi:hydrogenase maturation protease